MRTARYQKKTKKSYLFTNATIFRTVWHIDCLGWSITSTKIEMIQALSLRADGKIGERERARRSVIEDGTQELVVLRLSEGVGERVAHHPPTRMQTDIVARDRQDATTKENVIKTGIRNKRCSQAHRSIGQIALIGPLCAINEAHLTISGWCDELILP